MVDDSSADRTLCRVLLREEYGAELDFVEAPTARRGLELCNSLSSKLLPDCVLLDYKLPDMTGAEFLQRFCETSGGRSSAIDLPKFAVVMLTGLGNEQVAAEAIRAGAQDYLVKDGITAKSLRLAIEKAMGKVGLLKDLQAERDRLARLLVEKDQLIIEKDGLLSEKDALLEEVHHRVKNNLQVIASLLRLQAESFGDEKLTVALRESQNRVESMALIHEQLYQARNLKEVDLAENAALLANHLMHAYGVDPAHVQCRLQLAALPVGVDRAIPAALILNELISNALKHAFPEGRPGLIEVRGERKGGSVVLEVRDNGVGVANDARPAQTLGLNIVRILTRQLRGAFSIESGATGVREAEHSGTEGAGTICRLTFPEEGEKHLREQDANRETGGGASNHGGAKGQATDKVLQRSAG
jgi:two-component sensor histidine kinase